MDDRGNQPAQGDLLWRMGLIDAMLDDGRDRAPAEQVLYYSEVAVAAITQMRELSITDWNDELAAAISQSLTRIGSSLETVRAR